MKSNRPQTVKSAQAETKSIDDAANPQAIHQLIKLEEIIYKTIAFIEVTTEKLQHVIDDHQTEHNHSGSVASGIILLKFETIDALWDGYMEARKAVNAILKKDDMPSKSPPLKFRKIS